MEPSCILSWVSFSQNTKIRLKCALVCFWQNLMLSPVLDFVDGPRILIDHLFWGLGPFFMIFKNWEEKVFFFKSFTSGCSPVPILVKSHIQKLDATFQKEEKILIYWFSKNTLWFQQYMTLLLWSTKKELWVIFCLRPGSDEKYSCEFLQMGTWQGFIYEGGKWLQHFKKEKFLAKALIKNMTHLMLDPGYMCAEHDVAKWCLLSAITFFIWLACLSAEKEVYMKNYWCQISQTHNVCLCDYYL